MSVSVAEMTEQDQLFEYTVRLGDNCVILGQRLAEWCGKSPVLEEELALMNVGLDLLGQARMLLDYAGKVEGAGRDEDKLAFFRDAQAWRNLLLVEQPNGDFAKTMSRQLFFDCFQFLQYQKLSNSADTKLAEIATKSLKEITYHVRHSSDWVIRLGDGTEESHQRMQKAVDELWGYTPEMFDMDAVDEAMLKSGVGVDLKEIEPAWKKMVEGVLSEATLNFPELTWQVRGSKEGKHTEHLGYLLAEMQFLPRAYPDANW
ncbi:1,2-phenylacetyl-CoA epoxidase subunit PaaC [Sneathiella glossodoripedis]|uniref:1,2-phenylacetyl-CoA epoxidase subunit PaaC n=1 Tax=Sneathiella glossodoripedis TaxID=418853 RepID=UPI000AC65A49|nr:1,2-phenylacetyl-CoA epoxidase subunit PaaC [Sneathiella glossodoripedis]